MIGNSKNMNAHGSESNIAVLKDKQSSLSGWFNQRQPKKKRTEEDTDSDSPVSNEIIRQKKSCCSTDALNETLIAFREEMRSMNVLLNTMKEEQDARFLRIQTDVSEIKNQINEIKKNNCEIEKSVEYLGVKYDELEKFRQEHIETAKKQDNKVKDVVHKSTYLEKYNKSLDERIGFLEQKELNMNIEIVNVKKDVGENLMDKLSKIAENLKMNISDVENAWRVGGEKARCPIIVKFRTHKARNNWLQCRKIPMTNQEIYKNNDTTKIYINEHLTQRLRQLLWTVKNKLKDNYKFIWVQNGRILLRKDENDKKVENVRFESDIDNIIEKINK